MRKRQTLPPSIHKDIQASVLIYLKELALDPSVSPSTIDQLTESFSASGYETRREWVEIVVNELVRDGVIAGVSDPVNGVVEPTLSFIEKSQVPS